MTHYGIARHYVLDNNGTEKEHNFCYYHNVDRVKHDSVPYDKGSDLDIGDLHISIKSSRFTLMSGSLCKGCTTFDEIWAVYARNVHSNTFVYITNDYIVYMMNLAEFKQFVYEFCGLERESQKNGGYLKIKCRTESKKMLNWLRERAS
jgi:hypothetical protein